MDNSTDSPLNTSVVAVQVSLDERFSVLRNIGDECIDEDELRLLLDTKAAPVCYVWFVPSPSMDLAQGIMKTLYVNTMVNAGCKVKILIADWFAQVNYQIGSDLNKIRTVGYYNIEVWKAAGMDLDRVELVWLSDVINIQADNFFWPLVTDISQKISVDAIKRCCRKMYPHGLGVLRDKELLLPCLQCAGMLFDKEVDIWMLDMDQREASVLARKYCEDIQRENKPIILLNKMLPDLLEYPDEAGVSDPARALSIEDNEDIISYKIMLRAFCPPQAVKRNPCLEYIRFIILPWFGKFEVVQRNGCQKIFTNMERIIADYKRGILRAGDVKLALVKAVNKLLQAVHEHFRNNTYAKDLLEANKVY